MQVDLEHADALSSAAKAINPADGSYDPQSVLTAYALLEAEYGELTQLQRGSAEYIARAKELTEQTTASVYEQAAAYGVVTNRQAQAAQATANGQRERRFKRVEENGYQGGVGYLESTVRKAEEAGEDVTAAWNNALDELDAAGHLDAMCQMFGDISNLAVECGGDVEEIVRRLYEMRDAAQSISLSDMAEELRRERTANAAETDSYDDQVGALLSAFGEGGTEGVLAAMEVWNGFDESLQQSIAETYPSLVIALDDANQATQSLKEGVGELAEGEDVLSDSSQTAEKKMVALGTELNAAKKSSSAKYFKSTAKAIEELKHGAVSVSDAFGTYNKEAETAVKANEEYQAASKKNGGRHKGCRQRDRYAGGISWEHQSADSTGKLGSGWPHAVFGAGRGRRRFPSPERSGVYFDHRHIGRRLFRIDQRADQRTESGGGRRRCTDRHRSMDDGNHYDAAGGRAVESAYGCMDAYADQHQPEYTPIYLQQSPEGRQQR